MDVINSIYKQANIVSDTRKRKWHVIRIRILEMTERKYTATIILCKNPEYDFLRKRSKAVGTML